jgi:hypothetical protein
MPMYLTGSDGTEFELALIEETFEDMQDSERDDRWTTLSFRVAAEQGEWEETAPSVNLYELENLAQWLEAVAEGASGDQTVELLEPNLSFSLDAGGENWALIRVGFHLKDRPEWAIIDAPTDEAGFISLRIDRSQAGEAARELRDDLRSLTRR